MRCAGVVDLLFIYGNWLNIGPCNLSGTIRLIALRHCTCQALSCHIVHALLQGMILRRRLVALFVKGHGLQAADQVVLQQLLLISGGSVNYLQDCNQPLDGPEPWWQLLHSLMADAKPQSMTAAEAEDLQGLVNSDPKEAAPGRAEHGTNIEDLLSRSSSEETIPNQAGAGSLPCKGLGGRLGPSEFKLTQERRRVSGSMLHHSDLSDQMASMDNHHNIHADVANKGQEYLSLELSGATASRPAGLAAAALPQNAERDKCSHKNYKSPLMMKPAGEQPAGIPQTAALQNEAGSGAASDLVAASQKKKRRAEKQQKSSAQGTPSQPTSCKDAASPMSGMRSQNGNTKEDEAQQSTSKSAAPKQPGEATCSIRSGISSSGAGWPSSEGTAEHQQKADGPQSHNAVVGTSAKPSTFNSLSDLCPPEGQARPVDSYNEPPATGGQTTGNPAVEAESRAMTCSLEPLLSKGDLCDVHNHP